MLIYNLKFILFQRNLDAAREAFDAFLARYPYCYGYWKKYTDLEKKHDNFSEAEEVNSSLLPLGFLFSNRFLQQMAAM